MGNKGTCKACILLALCYLGPVQSKGTNVERVIHIHELHLDINQLIISKRKQPGAAPYKQGKSSVPCDCTQNIV